MLLNLYFLQQRRPAAVQPAAVDGGRGGGVAGGARQAHRRRGRAAGVAGARRRRQHHRRLAPGAPAPLPPDRQHHLGREVVHHPLSHPHRHAVHLQEDDVINYHSSSPSFHFCSLLSLSAFSRLILDAQRSTQL